VAVIVEVSAVSKTIYKINKIVLRKVLGQLLKSII